MHAASDHGEPGGRSPPALPPWFSGKGTPPAPPAAFRHCLRCGGDVSAVPTSARFCPRCGLRLPDDHAQAANRDPDREAARFTSMIVRGYATAMFRLGVRYEVRRNDDEAVRCYGKASHLGNGPATARLSDIPLAIRRGRPVVGYPPKLASDCRDEPADS